MKNDLKRDAPLALKLSEKQHTRIKKMNAKIWDHYTYYIADYYLPYLINGDASGLSNAERKELEEFEQFAQNLAKEDGFTVGHWAVQDNENYGMCEVSDKLGNVAEVWLMVYKDA
jgi:hypothetical protein